MRAISMRRVSNVGGTASQQSSKQARPDSQVGAGFFVCRLSGNRTGIIACDEQQS